MSISPLLSLHIHVPNVPFGIPSSLAEVVFPASLASYFMSKKRAFSLYGWVRKVRLGYIDLGKGTQTPESAMSLVEELNTLRKKNRDFEKANKHLQEENEILAEATAFFAANRRKSGKTKE